MVHWALCIVQPKRAVLQWLFMIGPYCFSFWWRQFPTGALENYHWVFECICTCNLSFDIPLMIIWHIILLEMIAFNILFPKDACRTISAFCEIRDNQAAHGARYCYTRLHEIYLQQQRHAFVSSERNQDIAILCIQHPWPMLSMGQIYTSICTSLSRWNGSCSIFAYVLCEV